MGVPPLEQLDSLDHRDEFRSRAILQAAITEAFALLNAGARQEAIAQIKQYSDLAARSNAGCYIFGLIYFNAGDLRHALTWFDRALALQPRFPEALSARTIVLQRLSQPHDALESFKEILKLRPRDAEALFSVGAVLQSLGRMTDALAAYEEAARRGPPDAETELNRGNVLQKLGRLEEALASYDLSSRYRDGYPQALYNKG